MGEKLTICDVGPRDGLQNQATHVPAEDKRHLIRELHGAGLRYIEATSFVNPKAVPQMADAAEVLPAANELQGLRALALMMNDKGYALAREAGVRGITVVAVCSETLAMKNNRRPARETIATAKRIVDMARADDVYVRVCLAAAWHCPYDGASDQGRVLGFAEEVWEMGVDELSVADTIGHAQPVEVRDLLKKLVDRYGSKVSAHFHDTQALGLANAAAALDAGVRILDSSVAGLGGCPFAKGAAGNLATEDLVLMAHKMGYETGIDLDKLWKVVAQTEGMVKKPTGGRTLGWWKSHQENLAAKANLCSGLPGHN